MMVLATVVLAAGCEDGINKTYGRRGGIAADSVNGTAVLANMFQQAGHHVSSSSRLTPRLLAKAEAIVWAPDDFAPPTSAVCEWFDQWWSEAPGRTLIYIGRDYDAAPHYWRAVQAGAPASQLTEIKRRLAADQSAYLARRNGANTVARAAVPPAVPSAATAPPVADCDWFSVQRRKKTRAVKTLSGDPQWLTGVDPSKLEIELNGRLLPSKGSEMVLASEGDAIVTREQLDGSELIVVANGSFLLNYPLVNHEHRKLAGKLIAEVGDDRRVVFLESDAGGPPVLDEDPPDVPRNGMEIFGVEPIGAVLLHLAFLGLVFCAARFPIFGRPRELPPPALSDFGKHISALGQMLQRTGDREYALGRVLHYQQHVRREPGRPPLNP
ncbi:MAG TPA: hypothetical protein VN699_03955 [Pirellulales bacterium]|nr:hypothetical protein [Pirellulales bacterium]